MDELAIIETSTRSFKQFDMGQLVAISEKETLASGSVYEQYSALGRVTATGKLVLSDSAASDGSEKVVAFLPFAMDATGGDVDVGVFKAGMFNADLLVLGDAHTVQTVKADLEGTPLFLRSFA